MVTILSIGRHSGRHAHRTGSAGPAAIHGTEALAAYLEHGGAIFRHNPLRQAATPGAPTYFPPLALEGRCLVDGGVFASNPALCAYAQARNIYPAERDFLLLSLGTGLQEHARPCVQVENWGIIKWAVPISGVMLNASSATVDYQLRALLGPQSYLRCQVQLAGASPDMDDASPENLRRLATLGEQTVRQNEAGLDRFCRALVEREHQLSRQNRVNQSEALRARLGAFASPPLL